MNARAIKTTLEVDLLVDTAASRRFAGLRGEAAGQRRFLFSAGDVHADLEVNRRHGCADLLLIGQLVGGGDPANFAGLYVELQYQDGTRLRGLTNELGEFTFDCPPRGPAILGVELGDRLDLTMPLPADALCAPGATR